MKKTRGNKIFSSKATSGKFKGTKVFVDGAGTGFNFYHRIKRISRIIFFDVARERRLAGTGNNRKLKTLYTLHSTLFCLCRRH